MASPVFISATKETQAGESLIADITAGDKRDVHHSNVTASIAQNLGMQGNAGQTGSDPNATVSDSVTSTRVPLVSVLAASDMHAHNTFDQPNAVMPTTLTIAVGGGLLNLSIPTASATKLDIVLR